jgi:hypothetical protein
VEIEVDPSDLIWSNLIVNCLRLRAYVGRPECVNSWESVVFASIPHNLTTVALQREVSVLERLGSFARWILLPRCSTGIQGHMILILGLCEMPEAALIPWLYISNLNPNAKQVLQRLPNLILKAISRRHVGWTLDVAGLYFGNWQRRRQKHGDWGKAARAVETVRRGILPVPLPDKDGEVWQAAHSRIQLKSHPTCDRFWFGASWGLLALDHLLFIYRREKDYLC